MKLKNFIFSIFLLLSFALKAKNKVIYGIDDRKLVALADLKIKELAKSVAAVVPSSDINFDFEKNTYQLNTKTLQEKKQLCGEVSFANFKTSSLCSSFLVGDDLLLTAGHCVRDQEDCNNLSFVFTDAENKEFDNLKSDQVYKCKRIVNRVKNRISRNDFSLVQLDRTVSGRSPLPFRNSCRVSSKDKVFIIGHPMGLPLIYADQGDIRQNDSEFVFVTNLDTFKGNSGSPVFNHRTGEVEGILVDGEDDLKFDKKRKCYVNRVCNKNKCKGEYVVRITVIPELVPGMTPDEPLIDPDNPFLPF